VSASALFGSSKNRGQKDKGAQTARHVAREISLWVHVLPIRFPWLLFRKYGTRRLFPNPSKGTPSVLFIGFFEAIPD
jgi:hypothetical protein